MAATNDENNVTGETATMHDKRASAPRKVLGDLPSNVQITPKASSLLHKKSMTGSPLKRSFNASIGNDGFTYLKRRRFSHSSLFEDAAQSTEHASINEDNRSTGVMHTPYEHPSIAMQEDPAGDTDRESSSERQSFSSLINYDPSSQAGPSSQAQLKALHGTPTVELSHAELLRMRLQVAMYKVRTQQTTVPFDYLREDTATGSRESSKAVQEAVEQLRQEALARLVSKQKPAIDPAIELTPALPISAMSSILSPERKHNTSYLAVTPDLRHKTHLQAGPELTSSAVKGQVAEGLLGLKNGF